MNKEQLHKLIEHLQGSCLSIDQACEELDIEYKDLSKKDLYNIDDKIFCCDNCGWWYDMGDLADKNDYWCRQCEEYDGN